MAAPQEPRGIDQVILLRLRQGVPHGFEQACWIPNFCPCLTKISLIKVYVCKPTDFDISSLTEGTISESATRRFTSRKRSSHASFAASPSCRKSTWRPTRESTLERNRESFCPLDDHYNLPLTFHTLQVRLQVLPGEVHPGDTAQPTSSCVQSQECILDNGQQILFKFEAGVEVGDAFLMVAHDTGCILSLSDLPSTPETMSSPPVHWPRRRARRLPLPPPSNRTSSVRPPTGCSTGKDSSKHNAAINWQDG